MNRILQVSVRVLVGFHALAAAFTVFFFTAFASGLVADDPEGTAVLVTYVVVGAVFLAVCLVAILARGPRLALGSAAVVAMATLVGARAIGGPGADLPADLPELVPTVVLLVLALVGLAGVVRTAHRHPVSA